MAWRVNEDRPDWALIHSAASRDNRCQPKDKQEEDGLWMLIAFERIIKYYKISEGIAKEL